MTNDYWISNAVTSGTTNLWVTASDTADLTYTYSPGFFGAKAPIPAKPKTALQWLDDRVSEMQAVGRQALA